jgi:hypothetical protein
MDLTDQFSVQLYVSFESPPLQDSDVDNLVRTLEGAGATDVTLYETPDGLFESVLLTSPSKAAFAELVTNLVAGKFGVIPQRVINAMELPGRVHGNNIY